MDVAESSSLLLPGGSGPTSLITDADPDNFEIDTDALNLSGFAPGDRAESFGFIAPFGAAPPDFQARAVVSVD